MAAPIRIDFGTQSNPGRLGGADTGPRHINAFVEKIEEGQPALPIYVPSGLTLFATVTDGGACRGGIVVGSQLVAVSGTKLVTMDSAGTVTDRGGIPGSSKVFMARNAKASTPQVVIVVDGNKYVYENNTLTEITDTDLPPPNSVTFLDQRLVFSLPDGRIFYSEIDEASSIGALSFATAEGAPDGLIRAFSHRLALFLFGAETTEIWGSTSSTANPFQRLSGGFVMKGTRAPHSVASINEYVYWVGDDDIPYRSAGAAPQALAHGPVCRALQAETDKTVICAFTYFDQGHAFYVLSGTDWTWQFNATTERWFERQSYNSSRWRTQFGFKFGNKTIVGDSTNSKFYQIDPDAHDENGEDLVWTVRCAPVHSYPNRVCVDRFHADMIPGVGLNSTDSNLSDPVVAYRHSDDGGHSWSRPRLKSLGAQGHHEERVVIDGLGATGRQGRIMELSSTAAVARGLRYAAIEGDQIGT